MAKKLVHIISAIAAAKLKGLRDITKIYNYAGNAERFRGETKTYMPLADAENPAEQVPAEERLVQLRARTVIADIINDVSTMYDLVYQQDIGNQQARADIIIDGKVLKKDVPVSFLLYIHARLKDVREVLSKLPTPPLDVEWQYDKQADLLRAKSIVVVNRTKKTPVVITKAQATDKHPAQAELTYEDKVVGKYQTQLFFGGLSADVKRRLMENLDKLIAAIEAARMTANMSVEAPLDTIAKDLFNYVIEPLKDLQ